MQILFKVTLFFVTIAVIDRGARLGQDGNFSSVLRIVARPVLPRRPVINGCARVFCFSNRVSRSASTISQRRFALRAVSQKSSCSWKSIEAPGSSKVDHFRSLLPSLRSIDLRYERSFPNKAFETRYLLARNSARQKRQF